VYTAMVAQTVVSTKYVEFVLCKGDGVILDRWRCAFHMHFVPTHVETARTGYVVMATGHDLFNFLRPAAASSVLALNFDVSPILNLIFNIFYELDTSARAREYT
jgi:hypothetical protein